MDATIAQLESVLLARTRGVWVLSGVSEDPDADASPRVYLADPIAYAIRKSGGTTASPFAPATADLATVAADKVDQCLDLAELRSLDNGLGNWTQTDHAEGPLSQKWAALAKFYFDRAECLRTKITEVYKVDADAPTVVIGDGLGGFSDGGLGGFSSGSGGSFSGGFGTTSPYF
jgi:hypothetical protein